jgi:hypothetical protein
MILKMLMCLVACATMVSCRPQIKDTANNVVVAKANYPVEFKICNQSFDDPVADIEVSLDGKQIFSGGLHVLRQHNYFFFTTISDELPRSITITSRIGPPPPFPFSRVGNRQISVEQDKPFKFEIDVYGTNIVVKQTEQFRMII